MLVATMISGFLVAINAQVLWREMEMVVVMIENHTRDAKSNLNYTETNLVLVALELA